MIQQKILALLPCQNGLVNQTVWSLQKDLSHAQMPADVRSKKKPHKITSFESSMEVCESSTRVNLQLSFMLRWVVP